MKQLLLIGAALLTLGAGAHAQQNGRNNGGNNNRNNNGGGNGGATLPLPEGVENLISIDAFNILLAQTNSNGERNLSPIVVRHIYSGGLARLFGGESVPTEQFVSPGQLGGNNGNQNNGQGNNGNQNNFGGQNGGFQGGNGGFQGGGFGGIGQGGFNNGGFQNGGNAGNLGGGTFGAFQMRRFGRGRN